MMNDLKRRLIESISSDLRDVLCEAFGDDVEGHSQYNDEDIINMLDSHRNDFLDSASFPSVAEFEDYVFTESEASDVRCLIDDNGKMLDDAVREVLFNTYMFFHDRERK